MCQGSAWSASIGSISRQEGLGKRDSCWRVGGQAADQGLAITSAKKALRKALCSPHCHGYL